MKTIKLDKTNSPTMCIECFLCGASIPMTDFEKAAIEYGKVIQPRICNDCRDAWKRIRFHSIGH